MVDKFKFLEVQGMASSKEYLNFVLEQLSEVENVRYRAMMGEYILYYREKVIGGIYDDRFLVKAVKSSKELIPNALHDIRATRAGVSCKPSRLASSPTASIIIFTAASIFCVSIL